MTRIIDLPEKTNPSGSDYIPITDSTTTSRMSVENLAKFYNSEIVNLTLSTEVKSDSRLKIYSGSSGVTYKVAPGTSILRNVPVTGNASSIEVVIGSDTRLSDARIPLQHSHSVSDLYNFSPTEFVSKSMIGSISGVCPLDVNSFVPEANLPFTVKSPVSSFNGRVNHILSQTGDYIASQITSDPVNLVTGTNLQTAIQQLSNATGIKVNAISGGSGSTVQSNLESMVRRSGDSMTGGLVLPENGLKIGTTFSMLNNTIGIGTPPNVNYTVSIGGNMLVSNTITATAFVNVSSIKHKYDVRKIEFPTEIISQLNGVKFKWKDSKKEDFGFIAEDVDDILPEIVTHDIDNNPTGVDYTKIIAILVESIKELKCEIESLKIK